MKRFLIIFLLCFFSSPIFAQEIVGQWNGLLKVQGIQLRLVFNITKTESGFSSTMDSPDQGAKGIPTTTTIFENGILKIAIENAKIEYEGTLGINNIITGTFKQRGQSFDMNLYREAIEKEQVAKPQEPAKPYSYYTEDITFENRKAKITLAGTLSLPNKNGVYPVVILISGSGAQNRDEEILGHKPFLVLSDFLTKNGFAVLRFDDRGTALSTGDFEAATSADFATDVESAIAYLKTRTEINKSKIGLIGHSEGGLIAPMVASKTKEIAFIVLLAGPGLRGNKILLLQQKLIGKVSKVSDADLQKNEMVNKKVFEIVNKSTEIKKLEFDLTNFYKQNLKDIPASEKPEGMSADDFIKMQVQQVANPWMQYFIKYNPIPTLQKVKCAVLVLNGEKDLQVPPAENLGAIKNALQKGRNKNITIKQLPRLNHLFQECVTGSPDEYATLQETISPTALTEILNWLQMQLQ